MKEVFKKICTIATIATMSIGTGIVSVSADELQENLEQSETLYDVCPVLNYTNEEVENAIEEMRLMAQEAGYSDEEIEIINSVWYSDAHINHPYEVNEFFTVIGTNAGYQVNNNIYATLEYGLTLDSLPFSVSGFNYYYNDALNLTSANLPQPPPVVSFGSRFMKKVELNISNLGVQTTNEGNIVKFHLDLTNNFNGREGYETIANNSCVILANQNEDEMAVLTCIIPGVNYNSDYYINYSVGGNGDLWYGNGSCGIVDNYDMQLLIDYLLHSGDLTPLQRAAADVNNDGVVNLNDYSIILLNGN